MSYIRPLDIHLPPGQSAFLWGARQTGESTYLRERFPDSVYLDLLDFDVRLPLSARPTRLGEQLEATSGTREAPASTAGRTPAARWPPISATFSLMK